MESSLTFIYNFVTRLKPPLSLGPIVDVYVESSLTFIYNFVTRLKPPLSLGPIVIENPT